jgi:biotin transporter BioY
MKTRELTRIALLATMLYIIFRIGGLILYIEWVNFTIMLYGVYLSRKEAWFSVVVFSLMVMLTMGIAPWSLMYLVVFPQYALIYSIFKDRIRSEYGLAALGFVLAFICGTLIDAPFMLSAGLGYKAFIARLLVGFQVSLGNGIVTLLSALYLLKPMKRVFGTIKYSNP